MTRAKAALLVATVEGGCGWAEHFFRQACATPVPPPPVRPGQAVVKAQNEARAAEAEAERLRQQLRRLGRE